MVDKEMLDAFPSKDKTQTGALHPGPRSPHGTAMSPEAERLRAAVREAMHWPKPPTIVPRDVCRVFCDELGITEEMVENLRCTRVMVPRKQRDRDKVHGRKAVSRSCVPAANALATILEVAGGTDG